MPKKETLDTIVRGGEHMGSFGGFYKGEKRKPKQDKKGNAQNTAVNKPVFVLPKMVEKKKKES